MDATSPPFRCSAASEARDEPLAGTASTVRSWLLLEHPGPWGRAAFSDARLGVVGLGAEIARRCRRASVRPLLIRRVDRDAVAERPRCFAVSSGPGAPWTERASLDALEDALALDLDALGRGERLGLEPHRDPLFLVCTHGRHDACCAERGRPLAFALARVFPELTWEASHVGGDRFAGNVVALPNGVYLGRVEPEEAEAVAGRYLEGRLSLPHYRGRSTMPMAVQFAEHALRRELGLDGIDDVAVETMALDGATATATFRTPAGAHGVTLTIATSPPHVLTCRHGEAEPTPVYRVREIVRVG